MDTIIRNYYTTIDNHATILPHFDEHARIHWGTTQYSVHEWDEHIAFAKNRLTDFHHTISSIPVHTKSLSSNTGEYFADIAYTFGGIYIGSISIRGTVITNFEGKFTSMHIYTLCYHHDVVRRESFGMPPPDWLRRLFWYRVSPSYVPMERTVTLYRNTTRSTHALSWSSQRWTHQSIEINEYSLNPGGIWLVGTNWY